MIAARFFLTILKKGNTMIRKNFKQIISQENLLFFGSFILLATIVLSGFYGGYVWHRNRTESQAQIYFSQTVREYEQLASSSSENAQAWQEIQKTFQAGYEKYGSSVLATFFLNYLATISLHEDKAEDALSFIAQSVTKISKKSPFYFALQTKLALMQIDSSDEATKKEGTLLLEKLASEEKENPFYDMALYYQGYNAWIAGDRQTASSIWAKLQTLSHQSFWAEKAYEKEHFLS